MGIHKRGKHILCAALLLGTAAAVGYLALLPVAQPGQRKSMQLSIADIYHARIDGQLSLVHLSDTAEAPDFIEAAMTQVAEQARPATVPEKETPVEIKAGNVPRSLRPVPRKTAPEQTESATREDGALQSSENAEMTQSDAAEPQKTHYSIPKDAATAPLPDAACFGEADSAADMAEVLQRAARVLEGQKMLFSPEIEIQAGSKIYYYFDDTIFSVLWKQEVDHTVFTYAETKVMDASQFRRHLSGGSFGSGKLTLTSEMSKNVNAVVGCSADYYSYRYEGITVVDGIVEKVKNGVKDNCFIDSDGNLLLEQNRIFSGKEEVQQYVDEHDIQFSLSFGPVLVKDGVFCCPRDYRLGQVYGNYPRAAICQMGQLHYLYMVSNAEKASGANRMLTMAQFADYVAATGCLQAYALDGGQTATVVMNGEVRNHVNYGSERPISDIIYFATAIPTDKEEFT